jgi:hypothetical protein
MDDKKFDPVALERMRKGIPQREVISIPSKKWGGVRAIIAKFLPWKNPQQNEIAPGGFTDDFDADPYISTMHERESQIRDDEVRMLKQFAERFGMPQYVAYIGSGSDASPIAAFPNAHTTFVDPDEEDIAALQKHYAGDARTFIAAKADAYAPKHLQDLLLDVCSAATSYSLHTLKMHGHLVHHATYSPWTAKDQRLKLIAVFTGETGKEECITDPEALRPFEELVDDFDSRWLDLI